MQIDRVRHDGGADDADRQQQRAGVGKFRRHRAERGRRPIDVGDEYFDQIAERDDRHEAADDQLDRAEAAALHHQDAVGDDGRDDHAGQQRHVEQQRQPDGAAEKLRQIGRHGGDFAHAPHHPDDRLGKLVAAHFRQVAPGDDAELGRQRLEQHGDQIGEQHHPEQAVAVFGAGLDVGGEIAGVHVGDRGDDRRPAEGQVAGDAGALAANERRARATVRSVSDSAIGGCASIRVSFSKYLVFTVSQRLTAR